MLEIIFIDDMHIRLHTIAEYDGHIC